MHKLHTHIHMSKNQMSRCGGGALSYQDVMSFHKTPSQHWPTGGERESMSELLEYVMNIERERERV